MSALGVKAHFQVKSGHRISRGGASAPAIECGMGEQNLCNL
jgi:hypothetical protein